MRGLMREEERGDLGRYSYQGQEVRGEEKKRGKHEGLRYWPTVASLSPLFPYLSRLRAWGLS